MTPAEEAAYALATADAAAWCDAHDFPAVAKALRAYRHRDAARGAGKAPSVDSLAAYDLEEYDLDEYDRDAAREAGK